MPQRRITRADLTQHDPRLSSGDDGVPVHSDAAGGGLVKEMRQPGRKRNTGDRVCARYGRVLHACETSRSRDLSVSTGHRTKHHEIDRPNLLSSSYTNGEGGG